MRRLGAYYLEKIAGRDDLEEREFPYCAGKVKIERDLFGWYLECGKETFRCRSEEEARFLYVFLDASMTEIAVPKDDAYLRSILPELERLKKKTDAIIEKYLRGILNRMIREQIRCRVLDKLVEDALPPES